MGVHIHICLESNFQKETTKLADCTTLNGTQQASAVVLAVLLVPFLEDT